MSDTKFTKGKWHCVFGDTYACVRVNGKVVADLRTVNTVYNKYDAHLIKTSPKMYEMLESVASELYMLIDEVNDQRASRITSQTESEPDYHDMQTLHEIQRLLAEARGEK